MGEGPRQRLPRKSGASRWKSTKGLSCEVVARMAGGFMGSRLFLSDLLTEHEPGGARRLRRFILGMVNASGKSTRGPP
jgi:hypothetical protein